MSKALKIKIRPWNKDRERFEVDLRSGKYRRQYLVPVEVYSKGKEKDREKAITNWATSKFLDYIETAQIVKPIEPTSEYTLSRFFEKKYLESGCATLSATTRYTYTVNFGAYIKPVLGDLRLSEITTEVVDGLLVKLQKTTTKFTDRKLSPVFINTVRSALVSVLRYAVDNGYMLKMPVVKKLKVPRQAKISDSKMYSEKQIEALCKAALELGLNYYAFVVLSVDCGLRVSETCALTYEAINWESDTITIAWQALRIANAGELKKLPKGEKERTITISARAKKALKQMQNQATDKNGRIFQRVGRLMGERDGVDSSVLRRWAGEITRRASLIDSSITPSEKTHCFRHSAASRIAKATGNVLAVQELLGHSNLSTSSLYIHTKHHSALKEAMDNAGTDLLNPVLTLVKSG